MNVIHIHITGRHANYPVLFTINVSAYILLMHSFTRLSSLAYSPIDVVFCAPEAEPLEKIFLGYTAILQQSGGSSTQYKDDYLK